MRSIAVLMAAAFVVPCAWLVPASHAATAQQVQDAIDNATKYVYSQMKGNNWEIIPRRDSKGRSTDVRGAQWGGITALSTYALLAAGENPQDPRLASAIEFLRKADLLGTYPIALRSLVWLNIPKSDLIRAAISKDAKLLLGARRTAGLNKGQYTFLNQGPSGISDHSNSEFGVLGVWACSDAVEIPDNFWTQVDASWRADQGDDGSWAYQGRPGAEDARGRAITGSVSMTAAGLATLFVTQDFLSRDKAAECSGNIVDKNIDSGIQWMSENFKSAMTGTWSFYGLYGVERIGAESGYKYFGDVDWYDQGTNYLIGAQNPADGSFPPIPVKASNLGSAASLVNTCFSLLFLSRGRAPVMMNKLQYDIAGTEANWNERPRDAFNIARWVGDETENTLNWQVSKIGSKAEDWHDAPILYLAGNQALNFTPEEQAKLKTFIEEGGLILGSADCGKKEFADSFRSLGSAMFQNREFTPLGAGDVIMHNEQFDASKWRNAPTLLGLSNGARELMLLIPDADPAKAWQMHETAGKEELFQLAANIFLYSVDKENMYFKGDTYMVEPNPQVNALHTIDVARIKYDGNWDPEPGGWRRLSAVMHNDDSIDVNAVAVEPALDSLAGKKIAHLTGTDRFRLITPDITALQQFIKDGGTLIVDAAGGKTPFTDSAEKTLHSIFGDDANQLNQPLPDDSPVYSAGGKLKEVTYRTFARTALGNLKSPRLRGIMQGGRLVCIYSPEDLSVGLVGEPVDGIIGYSPASATELMRKALLLASGYEPVKPVTASLTGNRHVRVPKLPSTKSDAKAVPE